MSFPSHASRPSRRQEVGDMRRMPSLAALPGAEPMETSLCRDEDMSDRLEHSQQCEAPAQIQGLIGSCPFPTHHMDLWLPSNEQQADLDQSAFCPWSYGAEPGVESWQPPRNAKSHQVLSPRDLKKCTFCRRTLGHYDIFMYRGDKAFCSLECRHHQIIIDGRQANSRTAGKRFSMVPTLGPAGVIHIPSTGGCRIGAPESQAKNPPALF